MLNTYSMYIWEKAKGPYLSILKGKCKEEKENKQLQYIVLKTVPQEHKEVTEASPIREQARSELQWDKF